MNALFAFVSKYVALLLIRLRMGGRKKIPEVLRRALVIREAAIGDVICMTPFLRELKRQTGAEIEFVVVGWAKDVLNHNPHIDRIHLIDDALVNRPGLQVLWKRHRYFRKLAKNGYDAVFYPTTQLKSKAALLAFPHTYKVGLTIDAPEQHTLQNALLDGRVYVSLTDRPRTRHIADTYLQMLVSVGGSATSSGGTEISISNADAVRVAASLASHGWQADETIIAVAPSAGGAVKNDAFIKTMPPAKMARLVRRIRKEFPLCRIALVGAASEREYVSAMNIEEENKVNNVVNFCGDFSLGQSAALLQQSRLLLCNDSGIAHIGAALQMNQLVFFGSTDEAEFGPYRNPNARVLRVALGCTPCCKVTCEVPDAPEFQTLSRPFCLDMIDEEKVLEWVGAAVRSDAAQKASAAQTVL